MARPPARPVSSRWAQAARRSARTPTDSGNKETLARIAAITGNARATWFAMLAALVFASVTLLGVQDVDFFAADRSTKLPVVGVSVPVTYFFAAGAVLVTAVYVYLHLYLKLLWTALGKAPTHTLIPSTLPDCQKSISSATSLLSQTCRNI